VTDDPGAFSPNGANGADAGPDPAPVRFGVEPFDVGYGAAFQADDDSPLAIECPVVEDGGALTVHTPAPSTRPEALAFVDGSMRTEARLTRSTADGTSTGIAGCISAGAVVAEPGAPLRFAHTVVRRFAIFTAGERAELPPQRGGWSWTPDSVPEAEVDHAANRLQRHMRDEEVSIAERLWADGLLTVLDGPLTKVRTGWDAPILGYVKTHHRPMLAPEHWSVVPTIGVRQRTSVFLVRDDLYATYLRVGDPGEWSSPWGGIVRLEVPAGVGEARAIEVLDAASAWLPTFASQSHRDPRAPVNLTPIGGLEKHIRHLQGDSKLAARAVRSAIVALNVGRPAA
jgi:hypothetical protein